MTDPCAVTPEAFRRALLALPELTAATVTSTGTNLGIDLEAQTASRTWSLRLIWSRAEQRLPTVSVRIMDGTFPLAHVNYYGEVCFTSNEGVAVDLTRPVEIVTYSVANALRTLEATFARHAEGDDSELLDEWEGYWGSLPGGYPVEVHLSIAGQAREIQAFAMSQNGCRRCMGFAERESKRPVYGARLILADFDPVRALYLPLATPVLAPSRSRPLGRSSVASWLQHASPTDSAVAERFFRSLSHRVDEAYVLFSQPRPNQQQPAAFGVGFYGKAARHPLLDATHGWKVSPIAVNRHDRAYLTRRGGGWPDLRNRQIAVVGCGAVGARVAEHLALGGVGRLVLVDPEALHADNLFRHVLPGDAVRMNKAHALKIAFERRLPGLEVIEDQNRVTQWPPAWATPSLSGVVLAIGDPYLERQLTRQFHATAPPGLPLVTCWMEPYGLGGHATLTVAGQPACLECLYRNAHGASLCGPKTAFAEPGPGFGQNLTGCGGAFTPYSAADATQTALIATRMLVATLLGALPSHYACWRGDAREFHDRGLRTSPWFDELDEAASHRAAREFSRCPCPVCGGT